MTDIAYRRSNIGMKPYEYPKNNGKIPCPVKHAPTIDDSCGAIGAGGSRCDRIPHSEFVRHHCCGDGWEKTW